LNAWCFVMLWIFEKYNVMAVRLAFVHVQYEIDRSAFKVVAKILSQFWQFVEIVFADHLLIAKIVSLSVSMEFVVFIHCVNLFFCCFF